MRALYIPAAFMALLAVGGCRPAGGEPAVRLEAAARATLAARPSPAPEREHDLTTLRRRTARYLAHRPGRAGLMVRDLRSGASFGWRAGEPFVAASVMKVNVLAGLLARRQDDGLARSERSLATRMIRFSDNSAADALYAEVGQGPGMSRINRAFGLAATIPYETRWGASNTSPADQVRLLEAIAGRSGPLTPASRRFILRLMESVSPGQDWGISAAAQPGEHVALKNGWTPLHYQGEGWAVNSIGRITGPDHDFVIAVLSAGEPTMASGVETVENLATLAVSGLRG